MSPSKRLYFDGDFWLPQYGDAEPPDRSALVPGEYLPNAATAGLLPGTSVYDLEPVYPNAQGNVNITVAQLYENKIFWGETRMQATATAGFPEGPVFRNCVFTGRDPYRYCDLDANGNLVPGTQVGGNVAGCITSTKHYVLEDCLIDPAYWMDPLLVRPANADPVPLRLWRKLLAFSCGIRGGRVTSRRVEIRNVQDGFSHQSTMLSESDIDFVLLEGNWHHQSVYYAGPDWWLTTDGTHSDGFQTNLGPNVTIRGCRIGGATDLTGYTASGERYNSGDDFRNAGLMLKQEKTLTPLTEIKNFVLEKSFIQAGVGYCINHVFNTAAPAEWTNSFIRDNYFVRRADGKYIIRTPRFADKYSNNRIIDLNPDDTWEVGEAVPITNGG